MKFRLLAILSLIFLLAMPLSAQKNHYRKADHGLQMVYKHITGTSLKDAIDSLLIEEYGALPDSAAVSKDITQQKGCGGRKSTNPNIAYIPNDSVTPPPVSLDEIVVFDGRGDLKNLSPVRIGFSGDDDLLKPFVLEMKRISSTRISATIELKVLPQLCQLKGLHFVKPAPRAVHE